MEKIFEVVRVIQEVNEVEFEKVPVIKSAEDVAEVAEFARELIGKEVQEIFLVICLNTKNRVTHIYKAFKGSLNASIAHPREVYRFALESNAASIIIAHQHPGGTTQPSEEDKQVTRRLAESGRIIGIELLDHVIVTFNDSYFSFRQNGYL